MAWEAREWSRTFGRVFRAVVVEGQWPPLGPGEPPRVIWNWTIETQRDGAKLASGYGYSPEQAMADADAWVASVVAEVADGR